jgi:hypothetical protein
VQIHPLIKIKQLKMMELKKWTLSRVGTLAGGAGMMAAIALPLEAATVAYWKFDNGSLTAASVGGPTFDLTNNGYGESAVNLVDPVPNPDGAVGGTNSGSIFANGAGSQSLIAGIGSSDPLALNGNSWTFEGWFQADNVARTLDPIFTTRGGQTGDGILFDIRNNADASAARLNLFVADGGSNTGDQFSMVEFAYGTPVHLALTWQAGVGSGNGQFEVFVDGVSEATYDLSLSLAGIDNDTFGQLELLGRDGDVDGTFGGFADEIRISDSALAPSGFLNVPEPSTGVAFLLGLGIILAGRRRLA